MFNVFFFGNRAVYEKMWGKNAERGRPHVIIWSMRNACWIPKATNTLTLTLTNTHSHSLSHTHTHSHTFTHTHTHTHTLTHTHTHTLTYTLTHIHTHTHTHTHSLCDTYCFATATMVAWRRLSITSYVQCLVCEYGHWLPSTWQWEKSRMLIIFNLQHMFQCG